MSTGSAVAASLLVVGALVGAGVLVSQPEEDTRVRPAPFWGLRGAEQPLPAETGGHGAGTSYVVAEVEGPTIAVHPSPDSATKPTHLRNPNEVGAPRVFLALEAEGDWLKVQVPVRPNASTGWIKRSDVVLKATPYRIRVALGKRELSLFRGNELVMREPVGVGKSVTATPKGLYYVTELLEPPDPNGAYGSYAFGTSAFSEVLTDFAGGDGVVGIHGTNDPSSIGKDVSHGCIRLSNAAVTRMAGMLPLGTPVYITA